MRLLLTQLLLVDLLRLVGGLVAQLNVHDVLCGIVEAQLGVVAECRDYLASLGAQGRPAAAAAPGQRHRRHVVADVVEGLRENSLFQQLRHPDRVVGRAAALSSPRVVALDHVAVLRMGRTEIGRDKRGK